MSKRFGRNQRRRARERIAELEKHHEFQRQHQAYLHGRLQEMREHLRYVGAVLGHMNILAGAPLRHMDGYDGMKLSPPRPLVEDYLDGDEMMCLEIMRLLDVKAVRDMASLTVHAIVELNSKKACYAISESALRTMKPEALRHFLERQVSPLLCSIIAEQVAGGRQA
jgi:hypothetical protein